MSLSRDQKKQTLIAYLKNEMLANETDIAMNQFFSYLNIPIHIKQKNSDELLNNVLKEISSTEINDLMYEIYDELNNKEQFDTNKTKCKTLILGLEKLYLHYAILQQKEAQAKAWTSTVWYSLLIFTIPLAYQFYQNKKFQNEFECNIQAGIVDNQLLSARDARDEKKHVYGLMNKFEANKDKTFKEILFSKKNQIRKFVPAGELGIFGGRGIVFYSTRAQLQSTTRKFINNNPEQEPTRDNTKTLTP